MAPSGWASASWTAGSAASWSSCHESSAAMITLVSSAVPATSTSLIAVGVQHAGHSLRGEHLYRL